AHVTEPTVRFGQVGSAALDVGAADDRLISAVEPPPGLALAVVVGRPDEQRRLAPSYAHVLGAFALLAAPDPDERIRAALAPDRRLDRVAGQHAGGIRQRQ